MAEAVLTQRQLNRAMLARQGLLERRPVSAIDMIERLAGIQAQVPSNPYVALWSRIERFDALELNDLIAQKRAVRAATLRATLHLHSAEDCLALQPILGSVLARTFHGQFGRQIAGSDTSALLAAGRALMLERPRTRAELVSKLGPRFPDLDPTVLGLTVTHLLPAVQVPPRGLWRQSGQATWALSEQFLPRLDPPRTSPYALIERYLAAFGPATVGDARTWSGLTGLRELFKRMRSRLRTFQDEQGRELFDVPEGLLPDPGLAAPPRFLPEYDNITLSHEDRTRVLAGQGPGLPFPTGSWVGTLLVDGFYRANWKVEGAVLTIDRFTPAAGDPDGTRAAIDAEGRRLLEFVSAGQDGHDVRFEPA